MYFLNTLALALAAVAASLSSINASPSQTQPPTKITSSETPGNPNFYDEFGRTRIFHGSNRVKKSEPWYFESMVNPDEAEMELMGSLGFNVIRLGYMWSGVNPSPGIYNDTYIDIFLDIVAKYEKHGIHVLVDVHEDILSSKFCIYDGAPLWVVNKSIPRHEFPWPLKGDCGDRGWMKNALAEAPGQAYQDIYDNNHGMLDDFTSFWRYSANRLKDVPNIIGYEVMNEPFAGDIYKHPELLLPGIAGSRNLKRMNDAVAKAIREVDNNHMIFFEPVTWGMVFNNDIAGSGYTEVPGGNEFRNMSAFSYHYYCSTFSPNYNDNPIAEKLICDKTVGPLVFKAVEEDLKVMGGAQMMTEGMSCSDDNQGECIIVANMLDDKLFSWTDYSSSQGDAWTLSDIQQSTWARTYARAITGTPTSMKFDILADNKIFDFCWLADLSIDRSLSTEIFTSSKYHYLNGKEVVATKGDLVIDDVSDQDLVFITYGEEAVDGEEVCVQITAVV